MENFVFALFLGGIIGWFLRGEVSGYNERIRAKIRRKI